MTHCDRQAVEYLVQHFWLPGFLLFSLIPACPVKFFEEDKLAKFNS